MNKNTLSPSNFIGINDGNIISFGSGEPDLQPPKSVYEILPNYKNFKYGLIQGEKQLRTALAKQYPNYSDIEQKFVSNF